MTDNNRIKVKWLKDSGYFEGRQTSPGLFRLRYGVLSVSKREIWGRGGGGESTAANIRTSDSKSQMVSPGLPHPLKNHAKKQFGFQNFRPTLSVCIQAGRSTLNLWLANLASRQYQRIKAKYITLAISKFRDFLFSSKVVSSTPPKKR